MILGKWPTWRTILSYAFIYIFNSLHVSSTSCHHQEGEIVSIQPLVAVTLCRWPCRVHDLHTTRPPTQSDSYQRLYWHNLSLLMMSTICSKHRVRNINKFLEKNCASRWSFTKNHYMMRGQQNIKKFEYIYLQFLSVKTKSIMKLSLLLTNNVIIP